MNMFKSLYTCRSRAYPTLEHMYIMSTKPKYYVIRIHEIHEVAMWRGGMRRAFEYIYIYIYIYIQTLRAFRLATLRIT